MFTSDTFIYLVKINIAFVVFYLFYRLLFSRDTFFTIRRACLLTILFLSVCYPLIPFALGEEQKMAIQESVSQYATVFMPEITVKPDETVTQFAVGRYPVLGVCFDSEYFVDTYSITNFLYIPVNQ